MRSLFVACALLSGTVYALVVPTTLDVDVGSEQTINVQTFPHSDSVTVCHVETPNGEKFDLNPEDVGKPGDKLELRDKNILSVCMVTIKNIDENDDGNWTFSYQNATGSGTPELYNIIVNPKEIDEQNEDDGIIWLNQTIYHTRTGHYIDITLSKISHEEQCYVRVPNGGNVKAEDMNIDGVRVQDGSEFVSCRITIGPMEQSLLGNWSLCGIYTDGEEYERCQPASISWHNANNPDSFWTSRIQPVFDHVVNFGGTLTPVVIGHGNVITCHMITPNGEDLVLDNGSEYPSLTRVAVNDNTACSIAIGPIKASLLGNWTIYGKFRNAVTGLTEERLPMHLFLYDEENPYDQAYNVTRVTENHVVNLGNILRVDVPGAGQIDSCQFKTPSGETYDYDGTKNFHGASFVDVGSNIACVVSIGPITEEKLGDWLITGKFSRNGLFLERQHIIRIIKEDPANPFVDDNRTVHDLNLQQFDTAMGKSLRIVINSQTFVNGESCHIRTPNGLQYILREGFSMPGIEVINEPGVECGVNVNVTSEDFIGNWTLILRASRFNEPGEWRLPFTVYVEEYVDALPKYVIINQGNDMYIRLRNPTDLYDTCKVIGPNRSSLYDVDNMHTKQCGYVVNNVDASDTGLWKIVYGHKIIYIALVNVTVTAGSETLTTHINLQKNRPVEQLIGPENAVYCRLEDPRGYTVFDGFGRCSLVLDRVTMEHHGIWKMLVGSPGKIIVKEHELNVRVQESEEKPLVVTYVHNDRPHILLSCSITTQYEVQACKFRDAHGRILLANQGVGEDRYVIYSMQESYESNLNNHSCGIRITDPTPFDLGLWRCSIDTEEETYYGFLEVMTPWVLQYAAPGSVISKPKLAVERKVIEFVDGESVTMSCSVQSAIRYCHFRNQNGDVFAISPHTTSPDMEYVGAGFDAGECGIRMKNFKASSGGQWTCAVRLTNSRREQQDWFQVNIKEKLRAYQYYKNERRDTIVVEATAYRGRTLEYCRFVRVDGSIISNDKSALYITVPLLGTGLLPYKAIVRYAVTVHVYRLQTSSRTIWRTLRQTGFTEDDTYLSSVPRVGQCLIHVSGHDGLNQNPWTVIAKISGHDEEVLKITNGLLSAEVPSQSIRYSTVLYLVLAASLLITLVGVSLGPKKNREWTHKRASQIGNTLRNSFRKQPKNTQKAYI